MGRMGYISAPAGAKKILREKSQQKCLLRFDSGNAITFEGEMNTCHELYEFI